MIKLAEKYKFSKKILDDQGIEAKEGKQIKVDLGGISIEVTITEIDGDQIFAVGK